MSSMWDSEDGEVSESVSVSLPPMVWAEVCAALKVYMHTCGKAAPVSARDALAALREIDRVMLGADDLAPPDDLLGGEA